jgi:hypothetical protein
MISVTPATSVTFFDQEFQEFLYASVSVHADPLQLSVLSALSRVGVDPWIEAAELAQLPIESATTRLVQQLSRLPAESWTQPDAAAIAERLIKLLPRRSSVPLAVPASVMRRPHPALSAHLIIFAALALTLLVSLAIR